MIEAPPLTLRLRLDKEALASNWRALDAMSGAARAGAAVKANCYGLGIAECLPILREAGATDFFVAHWSEVDAVRAHVDPSQIAVLHGCSNTAEAQFARATGAIPVINSLRQAQVWSESGGGPCHVMVDTGINRLGLRPADLGDSVIQSLEVDILMSHLACADEDGAYNAAQQKAFDTVRGQVPHTRASLANSAGIALGPAYHHDLTRPGLALYGGVPRAELAAGIRQVAHVEAALIQRRELNAGDRVGYNGRYIATAPMDVGIVSLGYADGILRAWSGQALRHGSAELPILGTVSMDMVVCDLRQAPDLQEGDWIELPYDLPTASQATGLSQYELLTVLGRRLTA